MEELLKTRLEKADELLSKAENELYKPEEDVVPYSVCQNAYRAVINYLGSYLTKHGEEFKEATPIKDLLTACRNIDPNFNELHLAPMYHPIQSEDVWMNMDTANSFVAMAKRTKNMIMASH
ncbi:hypothetical protein [Marivirga arenosa]|uniref:HEPN domain-containing protein n=1 Tax=Marivirga arenosa TaxID=3059076 RepID=A0AA49GGI6_9BACT|nr:MULTISPECIES: hypothetical protein [unclassified Marivirga]WKK80643.1 hypothetical protein QYS47_26650 [Marivirga sp. BKB1-2]WKK84376.1 hypothetical protein QYS48_19660 [Marivirga sp. ABR2-2]